MTARGRAVDEAALIKGASTGFTVLIIGELLSPLASGLNATLGLFWLSLVGAAGFVVAGTRVGIARRPAIHGALAALAALALTVPLRLIAGGPITDQAYALFVSAVFGMVVGAIAGRGAGRLRDTRHD